MELIKIDITILKPIEKVWEYFNAPEHIPKWNFAHESWHCPMAENNLEIGGKLHTRMEAKDGSFGFDLVGIYDDILPCQFLKYHLEDGRTVEVFFEKIDETTTKVTEVFEPESQNPLEAQRGGWGSVLTNFKNYAEGC